MKGLLITATDSGAGKTYVTSLILKALLEQGQDAVGYLPVSCGDRGDAVLLHKSGSPGPGLDDINPVHLKNSTVPYIASLLEGADLDITQWESHYARLAEHHEFVLVDGSGGWETPLFQKERFSHFSKRLNLPILLVVSNNPGMLNHTLLTVQAIKNTGQHCIGLIINNMQEEWTTASLTNRGVIEELTDLPILGELIAGQDFLDIENLMEAWAKCPAHGN